MPIPVTCGCGKKFAAKDELAGKRLKCPACGQALDIPQPPTPARVPASTTVDPLFGGGPLAADPFGSSPPSAGFDLGNLSGFDSAPTSPLGGTPQGANSGIGAGFGSAAKGASPYGAAANNSGREVGKNPSSGGMDFGMKLALFGGGGLILLVGGVFCIYAAISSFSEQVAHQPTPVPASPLAAAPVMAAPVPSVTPALPGASPSVAPGSNVPTSAGPPAFPPSFPPSTTPAGVASGASGNGAPGASLPAFPPAFPPGSTAGTAPGASIPGAPSSPPRGPAGSPAQGGSGKPFAGGIAGWHGQANATLLGARPVKGEEMVVYQYSWLCDVLPFLGYEDVYNKFDFKKPWTDEPNYNQTRLIVPQFINPHDDRRGWKGYPFQGSALTHFAGISGIEDQRNVVAAELPRTDPRAGVFGYRGIAKPAEITDGTSNTLMVIGSGQLAGLWVQGGGATIRGAREPYFDSLTGFGSRGTAQPGAMAMFADGSVRHIPASIDPKVFRAICTIRGAETVDLAPLGAALPDFPKKQ